MNKRRNRGIVYLAAGLLLCFGRDAFSQSYVCAETNLGDFCMALYTEAAPRTVTNFLNYVEDGDYDQTLIHRSIPTAVIQGGGYYYDPDRLGQEVPKDPPIANEFGVSNLRGSVAMAKFPGRPDSADSEWFINVDNNGGLLDFADGGYTVFARIVSGMEVVDEIATLGLADLRTSLGAAFGEVPVLEKPPGGIRIEDFVQLRRIYATEVLPQEAGAVAQFDGSMVIFPVRIDGKLYQASMALLAGGTGFVFEVDRSQIIPLQDDGREAASFSAADGMLLIPSVQVGQHVLTEVSLALTDSENLEFTLEDYTRP